MHVFNALGGGVEKQVRLQARNALAERDPPAADLLD
jgi:hypothetical protein